MSYFMYRRSADIVLATSVELPATLEHAFLRAALLFILTSFKNCRESPFSWCRGHEILIQILHFSTGLCSAAGRNPVDSIQGRKEASVALALSLNPGPESFRALTWSFNGTSNDVMSTSTDVVGKRYENRITLNKHTGSLLLTNLMEDDSGEYELIIIPYGGQQLLRTATLKVLRKSDPKNKLHTTVNNWACLLNYEFMLPECDASQFFFFLNGIFLCSVSIFNVQAQFVLSKCCPNRRSVCQARLWCRHLCVQTVDEGWRGCGVRWEIQPPWQQHNGVHRPPGPHRLGRGHLPRQQRLNLWFSQMQHPGQVSNLLLDLQVHNQLSWKRSTWGNTVAGQEAFVPLSSLSCGCRSHLERQSNVFFPWSRLFFLYQWLHVHVGLHHPEHAANWN